jgi:hypothetical protein
MQPEFLLGTHWVPVSERDKSAAEATLDGRDDGLEFAVFSLSEW